nr:unnamed protein product [Callosobruchus chinensis]
MIKCCICKKLFKNSCVDISSAEARLLNSNKGCDWSCKVCRSFGNDIKDLKALILKLQDDIQAFKTTRSDDANLNRNEFLEEVISELSERNKRRKNVIIFGVPEQDANDDGDTADKDKVTDILHTIDRNFSLQDVKIVRLGKQTGGKIRPIRVTCNTEQQVSDIVRNAGKLKNSRFKNKVFVATDRTPKQLAYFRELKDQLKERMDAGESDLKIRHFNGVPRIVSENH